MRRRAENGSGSFELLLDTMCNMFGGIILMALLVVILTQSAADKVVADSQMQNPDIRIITAEINGLLDSIRTAEGELELHRRQLEAFTDDRLLDILARRESFEKARREADERLEEARAEVEEAEELAREADALLLDSRRRLEELRREVERFADAAQRAVFEQQAIRLPIRRGRAAGTAAFIVIEKNKAYHLNVNIFGDRWGDCLVEEVGVGVWRIRPDRTRGVEVGENQRFEQWFGRTTAGSNYVVFAIYCDSESYSSFQFVKNRVLENGKQYVLEWVMGPDDEYFTASRGSDHVPE